MAMAAYQVPMKPAKPGLEERPQEPIRKIRITLSSKKVKNLEKGCQSLFWFYFFWIVSLICSSFWFSMLYNISVQWSHKESQAQSHSH